MSPAVSKKQRIAMAIAEHHPEKLYARNAAMKKMSHQQLHDFASKGKSKVHHSPTMDVIDHDKTYSKTVVGK